MKKSITGAIKKKLINKIVKNNYSSYSSLSKVENQVFQMGEKCYTYKPHHTSCKTIQSKVIDFA